MEKKNAVFWVKLFSVFGVLASWIVFYFWRRSNPNITLTYALAITIVISLMGIFVFFKNDFLTKNPKNIESEVPKEISEEERREMLVQITNDVKWDNVKSIKLVNDKTVNKNHVYAYKVETIRVKDFFIGIINANYPERKVTIIDDDKKGNEYYIEKRMNSKAENPFLEPNVEESEESLDPFGKPIRKVRKTIHPKIEEKKEEKVI